jgi:hypothetical protein
VEETFKIDFVGIGASKCGTTWLGHMLEAHPELCLSEPKEVHYFNDLLTFRSVLKPNFGRGIEWYRKFFNHCNDAAKKGEITPRYSTDPIAAKRIREHNPEIKIFYCLRHPVDRIWSHYQFTTHFVGKEDRPIMQALREEPEYLNMTRYHRNLSFYKEQFDDDQIFIIWFEDIYRQPAALLREIFTFLGVDPDFQPPDMDKKSNAARVSKSVWLQRLFRRLNYIFPKLGLTGIVKRLKRAGLNKFVTNLNTKPLEKQPIPEEARKYILEHLTEDIRQLEKLLNKDLSHWLK